MTRLFIHNIFFRLIGPLFIGVAIYLLILLLNNSISLIDDLFANQELYLCIVLVYLVLEATRLLTLLIVKKAGRLPFFWQICLQTIAAMFAMLLIVRTGLNYYFGHFLGYEPSSGEYTIFFSIYGFATALYLTLHLSHLFLYKENKMKLEEEKALKEALEFEFRNFKREMSPSLLLESLESLIALVDEKQDAADELIDELSAVYRYMLGNKSAELVPLNAELDTTEHLINLFWHKGREIDFKAHVNKGMCVPGAVLQVVEWMVKSSIHSTVQPMSIEISTSGNTLIIESERKPRLSTEKLYMKDFQRAYAYYSDGEISIEENDGYTMIKIPLLLPKEAEA